MNSPEEIEELCNEMMDRIENKWIENRDNIEIQTKFWDNYKNKFLDKTGLSPIHGELRAKMCSSFLKKNSEWLI